MCRRNLRVLLSAIASFAVALLASAADSPLPAGSAGNLNLNLPQEPFRLFGNAYYVGTRGLSSVLITSDKGHVLIDGALPESAPRIAEERAAP